MQMNCPGHSGNWSGTEERVVHVPPVCGSASFSEKKCCASNGTVSQAMSKEITRPE